jgi:hypothetical protein
MSSVGMLGIAGIEAQLGMLGIARYALFRAISSAVNDRQRATRDWLCTHLLGCATEVIPKQLCSGVLHGMRSIKLGIDSSCSVLLGIAGCAGIAYRAIPSGRARSVFGIYRLRYTEAYRARYTTLILLL